MQAIEAFGKKTYFVKSDYRGPVNVAFDSFEKAKSVAQKKGSTYFVYTMNGKDIEVVWVQEKRNTMKTIKITEEVRLPGTNVILEKGDRVQVLNEVMVSDYREASIQLINRTGMDIEPIIKSDSELFLLWLDEHFNVARELDMKGDVRMWFNSDRRARGLWDFILSVCDRDSGAEIQMTQFIDHGTQWSAMRTFSVTTV